MTIIDTNGQQHHLIGSFGGQALTTSPHLRDGQLQPLDLPPDQQLRLTAWLITQATPRPTLCGQAPTRSSCRP